MKKTVIVLISILAAVWLVLAVLGSGGEYAAERLLYRASQVSKKIAANPDVVPPAMAASVEKDLRMVVEKYPGTKTARAAHLALAGFYAYQKKYDNALTLLDKTISAYGQDKAIVSESLFLKGNTYERQGQWDKALEEYTMLQSKYADTPLGLQVPLYIANYYTKNGKDAEADSTYNEAVTFYEKMGQALGDVTLKYLASTFLAQAYLSLKRYEDAGRVIEDTLNRYPSIPTYVQHLPSVELVFVNALKRPDKAIEIYTHVKEKTSDSRLKTFLDQKIAALRGERAEGGTKK